MKIKISERVDGWGFHQLKNLYKILIKDIDSYKNLINPFFFQVGKKYNTISKKILFVGKSTNGWITSERDVEKLFDMSNSKRIVNRDDQMEWVNNLEGKRENDPEGYNTRKSAFWRLIKNISSDINKKEDWYNYIAWTNLYKIAPASGGNPSKKLRELQEKTCIDILNEEIRLISPDFIIFFTSNWEKFYINSLKIEHNKFTKKTWDDKKNYEILYKKLIRNNNDKIILVLSKHPQGKKEQDHKNAIMEIFKKYK